MTALEEKVKLLEFRFINHHFQTDRFTWDYLSATDEEVLKTTYVFPDTIDGLSSLIIKIVLPKYRPQVRKHIAYLIGLRERQTQAWESYLADCEKRFNNTNSWVQQNTQ